MSSGGWENDGGEGGWGGDEWADGDGELRNKTEKHCASEEKYNSKIKAF